MDGLTVLTIVIVGVCVSAGSAGWGGNIIADTTNGNRNSKPEIQAKLLFTISCYSPHPRRRYTL